MTSLRHDQRRVLAPMLMTLAIVAGMSMVSQSTAAQTFHVIYTFTGHADGGRPQAPLAMRGNTLYGVTPGYGTGGTCYLGCGTAFKIARRNSSWLFTPLHQFGNLPDGNFPVGVVVASDGSLYGATLGGGTDSGGSCALGVTGCGTIFRLQPPPTFCSSVLCPWNETVLYRFTGLGGDGGGPYTGNLTFDSGGNLYGTTEFGGAHDWGSVFEMSPSQGGWTINVIYSFSIMGQQGWGVPETGVIMDQTGNLYGTTIWENNYADGVIYQLTPSPSGWTANVLQATQCDLLDGCLPLDLTFDSQGNILGTYGAGGLHDTGTVFKLLASQGWSLDTLYNFTSRQGSGGRLAMDAAGNLYGADPAGGTYGAGTVFKLTLSGDSWTYTDLYDFTGGSDGANPYGSVVLDSDGNIYGTTNNAGNTHDCIGEFDSGCGTVWEITP